MVPFPHGATFGSMLALLCGPLSARSSALPLRPLHTGQQLRRCCGPRATVSEAEEAASLEAFAVEAQAEAAAARSPSAMALCREAADAEVAQLQASGDARLVELLEASQAVSGGDVVASGIVLQALRKPKGTISIVAEGVPVAAGSKLTGTPGTLCSGWRSRPRSAGSRGSSRAAASWRRCWKGPRCRSWLSVVVLM